MIFPQAEASSETFVWSLVSDYVSYWETVTSCGSRFFILLHLSFDWPTYSTNLFLPRGIKNHPQKNFGPITDYGDQNNWVLSM